MSKPDQYQTTENLTRVANEAGAWISYLNMMAATMEGRIRGYQELVGQLPPSPVAEQLRKQLAWDIKAIDDIQKRGPITLS